MKKIILFVFISFILSGCSLFRVHKTDVDQGNIFTETEVSRLHKGMTEAQIKAIMGNPILVNIFTPNRIDYIYTFQAGYGKKIEQRVTLVFGQGRLREIDK